MGDDRLKILRVITRLIDTMLLLKIVKHRYVIRFIDNKLQIRYIIRTTVGGNIIHEYDEA